MKRLHFFVSISLVVLFCFAAMAWAQEASFYDETKDKIIRVCTGGVEGAYTIKLEVKNTDAYGTNDTTYSASCNNGATGAIPLLIATPTDSVDVSLAYDAPSSAAYVFYTTNGIPTLVKCTLSSLVPTYSISGTVTTGGNAMSGVTMTLGGSASGTTATNRSGVYSFANLIAGTYTVTPAASGYSFTPSNWSGDVSADKTGIDFSGTATSGLPDLIVTRSEAPSGGCNYQPFDVSATINNNGTAPAGSFTVKVYFSGWDVLNKYATLLGTWNVDSLAAGESLSHTFSNLVFSGASIHCTYYIHVFVDANKQVVESNEKNNVSTSGMSIAR